MELHMAGGAVGEEGGATDLGRGEQRRGRSLEE